MSLSRVGDAKPDPRRRPGPLPALAAAIQGPTSHPRTPGEDAEAWLRPAMLIAAFGLTAATLWALFSPLRTLKVQPDPTPCW